MLLKIIKTVLKILPRPILYAILKLQKMKLINLSFVNLIREKSLDYLSNSQLLELELLLQLGLNKEKIFQYQFPQELDNFCGYGLFCWQYPNQFSKYLVQLSKFKIESYLEIGVRHGGTFVITVEYLERFQPLKKAIGIDICYCPSLVEYKKINPKIDFLQIDSTSDKFKKFIQESEGFDLVLIDGDHDEILCRNDFKTVKDKANIIVFHDIVNVECPGVVKVWNEVKEKYAEKYKFFEYTDQYKSVYQRTQQKFLGIGMAVRKKI